MTSTLSLTAPPTLDAALASRLAGLALDNVVREYPNKLDHVQNGERDAGERRREVGGEARADHSARLRRT